MSFYPFLFIPTSPFILPPPSSSLLLCRSSVSLQDPFSEGNDPSFPRKNLTPNSAYQAGMNTPDMQGRMGSYEPNKDPFGNMRKGVHLRIYIFKIYKCSCGSFFCLNAFAVGEQFLPANQGSNSGVGDQQQQQPSQQQQQQQPQPPFNRGPPGAMSTMPMGPRQQYPYGPGYDRRYDSLKASWHL